MTVIEGEVAAGWEPVRDAFVANFAERGEVGAGVAVVHGGQLVVDLVGGHRDRDRSVPYGRDALQLVFSTTKGVAAACVALCVQRGWLDPDCSCSDRCGPRHPPPATSTVGNRSAIRPASSPSSRRSPSSSASIPGHGRPRPGGHHARVGARHQTRLPRHHLRLACRRARSPIRSKHRSLGTFLGEEIAGPLSVDLWIGLPAPQQTRVLPD